MNSGQSPETKFAEAARYGRLTQMKDLLREHPTLNVNHKNETRGGWTALHWASQNGHGDIVTLLLHHPAIDVNVKTKGDATPLAVAAEKGSPCVRLLLQDARVEVNNVAKWGDSALDKAITGFYMDTVRLFIASGRDLELGGDEDEHDDGSNGDGDSIRLAERVNNEEAVTLLQEYKEDPEKVRDDVRRGLGIEGSSIYPSIHLWVLIFLVFITFTSPSHPLPFSDFPVGKPPKVTKAQYLASLDGIVGPTPKDKKALLATLAARKAVTPG